MSGAVQDRPALVALREAAPTRPFEAVLVDDFSRLARDNLMMLEVLAELAFNDIRIISVSENLDSLEEDAELGIQIHGVMNQLYLKDLKNEDSPGTARPQGEGTVCWRKSIWVPVGPFRRDETGQEGQSSAGWMAA